MPQHSQQKKRVRIRSLDSQEGERLNRNDLRAKGNHPLPRRQDGETPLKHFLAKKTQSEQSTNETNKELPKTRAANNHTSWLIMLFFVSLAATSLCLGTSSSLIALSFVLFPSIVFLINQNQFSKLKSEMQARAKDPSKWMQENKDAYDLGTTSKNWIPYLKSYVQPSAYSTAFHLGLNDALEAAETERPSAPKA